MKQTEPWALVKRLTNVHRQGAKPNLFLFSTARSGSTWVVEMLATQPGMKLIDEPLLPSDDRAAGRWSPRLEDLLPRPGREDELATYFDGLIRNKIGAGSPHPFHRFHRTFTDRITFKILRCKDLMNWFETRFSAQIVYLVRHPISTSLSRRVAPLGAMYLENDEYCERFLTADQRAFGRRIVDSGTVLQAKVLDWCLQNLPPLVALDRGRWCCLHYESLVMQPEETIHRLAQELDLGRIDVMLKRVAVASGSSNQSDRETRQKLAGAGGKDRSFLVEKWRSRITPAEEAEAFDVVEALGIETYSRGEVLPTRPLDAEPVTVQSDSPSGGSTG